MPEGIQTELKKLQSRRAELTLERGVLLGRAQREHATDPELAPLVAKVRLAVDRVKTLRQQVVEAEKDRASAVSAMEAALERFLPNDLRNL